MSLTGAGANCGSGAYREGATGGQGLGSLADRTFNVSAKGLQILEEHLAKPIFEKTEENAMMIQRLREALQAGAKVAGADASFYLHEIAESTMMSRGLTYALAHQGALTKYGVSEFSVYHPDVITALWGNFATGFKDFWGLSKPAGQ